jgi:hypothetical protein
MISKYKTKKTRRKAYSISPETAFQKKAAGKAMGTYLKYRDSFLDKVTKIKLEPRKEKHMKRDQNHRNKTGSPADIPFDAGHKNITALNETKSIKNGNTTFTKEDAPVSPGLTYGDNVTFKVESPAGKIVVGDSVVAPHSEHRTTIETGRPTTKGLKMVEKVNGKMKILLMDTKLYDPTGVTQPFIQRSLLDHAHGFNSKRLWVMPGAACPGYRDLFEVVMQTKILGNLLPRIADASPLNSDDRRLLSIKNFQTEISFANENSSLPLKMKFHIVRSKVSIVKNNDASTNTADGYQTIVKDLNDKVFVSPDSTGGRGAIPSRYLHSSAVIVGQSQTNAVPNSDNYRKTGLVVDMEPRAYLGMSAHFRDKYEIVKTFSKTLKSNDIWRIKHTQHMGSGIDMDAARVHYLDMNQGLISQFVTADRTGNDEPLTYFYIVETMGTSLSAVVGDVNAINVLTPSTYQGTSPGQYHTEFRTYIEYLIPGNNPNIDVSVGGLPEGMHARFYKKRDTGRPTELAKQRFILPENIVYNLADVTAGKAFIPVFTDKSIVGAGFKGLYGNAP